MWCSKTTATMTKKILIITGFLLAGCFQKAVCQDTAALVQEFTQLMLFTDQPYLYYTTTTTVASEPIMQPGDTMSLKGVYYKNGGTLYFSSGQDETFIQDSLVFQVNRQRKSIWISKSGPGQQAAGVVTNNEQVLQLLKKRYTIKKEVLQNGNSSLIFDSKQDTVNHSTTSTSIEVEYTPGNKMPKRFDFVIHLQEPAGEDLKAALQTEGINVSKALQTIGGEEYLIRLQKMSVAFTAIDNSKEKVTQAPLWTDKIEYSSTTGEFKGKGDYSNYEVTKMF